MTIRSTLIRALFSLVEYNMTKQPIPKGFPLRDEDDSRPVRLADEHEEFLHDQLVELHNEAVRRGIDIPDFLRYLQSWVIASVDTAVECGYYDVEEWAGLPGPDLTDDSDSS